MDNIRDRMYHSKDYPTHGFREGSLVPPKMQIRQVLPGMETEWPGWIRGPLSSHSPVFRKMHCNSLFTSLFPTKHSVYGEYMTAR